MFFFLLCYCCTHYKKKPLQILKLDYKMFGFSILIAFEDKKNVVWKRRNCWSLNFLPHEDRMTTISKPITIRPDF